MSKQLTHQLLLQKTKASSFQHVRQINLWGNDLTDVSLLSQLPNLEIAQLASNQINSLSFLTNCTNIQELYLSKNQIKNIEEIYKLINLPNLKVLTLIDNPICSISNYRQKILQHAQHLERLDDLPVLQQERQQLEKLQIQQRQANNIQQNPVQQLQQQATNEKKNVKKKVKQQNIVTVLSKGINKQELEEFQASIGKEKQQKSQIKQIQEEIQQIEQQQISQLFNFSVVTKQQIEIENKNVEDKNQFELETNDKNIKIEKEEINQNTQQQKSSLFIQKQQTQNLVPNKTECNNPVHSVETNQNLLCAIIALLKELDNNQRNLLKQDIDKKLKEFET